MIDLSAYAPFVAGFLAVAVLAIAAAVAALVIVARDRRAAARPVLALVGHREVAVDVHRAA